MAQLVETQHDNDHEAAKPKTVEVKVSILPQGEAKEIELSLFHLTRYITFCTKTMLVSLSQICSNR
jgi:hypothetical protein